MAETPLGGAPSRTPRDDEQQRRLQARQERLRKRQLTFDRKLASSGVKPRDEQGGTDATIVGGDPEHYEDYPATPSKEDEDEEDSAQGRTPSRSDELRKRLREREHRMQQRQEDFQSKQDTAEEKVSDYQPGEAEQAANEAQDVVSQDQIRARAFKRGLQEARAQVQQGVVQAEGRAAAGKAAQGSMQLIGRAAVTVGTWILRGMIFLFATPVGWVILGIFLLILLAVLLAAATCDAAANDQSVFKQFHQAAANFLVWLETQGNLTCPSQ